jgi:hypothetical protein
MATAITATVISSGIICRRRLGVSRAARSGAQTTAAKLSPAAWRLDLTSTSHGELNAPRRQHDRRKHDHVANRRSPIVNTQATTIINDIGAT